MDHCGISVSRRKVSNLAFFVPCNCLYFLLRNSREFANTEQTLMWLQHYTAASYCRVQMGDDLAGCALHYSLILLTLIYDTFYCCALTLGVQLMLMSCLHICNCEVVLIFSIWSHKINSTLNVCIYYQAYHFQIWLSSLLHHMSIGTWGPRHDPWIDRVIEWIRTKLVKLPALYFQNNKADLWTTITWARLYIWMKHFICTTLLVDNRERWNLLNSSHSDFDTFDLRTPRSKMPTCSG